MLGANLGRFAKGSFMRGINILTIVGVALAWVSITAAQGQRYDTPKVGQFLEGRIAGKAMNCLPIRGARPNRVIDGTAIVYAFGDILFVNRPATGAEMLSESKTLVRRGQGSQLCKGDVIDLVDPSSHTQAGSIVLGDFVPYRRKARSAYSGVY
jgi:hypothetical protein